MTARIVSDSKRFLAATFDGTLRERLAPLRVTFYHACGCDPFFPASSLARSRVNTYSQWACVTPIQTEYGPNGRLGNEASAKVPCCNKVAEDLAIRDILTARSRPTASSTQADGLKAGIVARRSLPQRNSTTTANTTLGEAPAAALVGTAAVAVTTVA